MNKDYNETMIAMGESILRWPFFIMLLIPTIMCLVLKVV